VGTDCLSFAAPIPPLALFGGQERIARLRDGCGKNVQATDVLMLAGNTAELMVHLARIPTGELRNAADAEKVKITFDSWTHRNELPKTSVRALHNSS